MATDLLHSCSFSGVVKIVEDQRLVEQHTPSQRGVWSKSDLQALLADRHPASFARRINSLIKQGTLRRFVRGHYVSREFDLATLSQRLGPDSYVSFATVLAEQLVIGPRPLRQILACRTGATRTYRALGFEIVHLHIAGHLDFGHSNRNGVQVADAEKATLDSLYFHQRGRSYPFDIYTDLDVSKLDRARIRRYLARYRNPKFVAFAKEVLGA
jgi:hypothetical protein